MAFAGSSFFEVETYDESLPETIMLAVNEAGIHLLTKSRELLASHSFRVIMYWSNKTADGGTDPKFIFKSRGEVLQFKTPEGWKICQALDEVVSGLWKEANDEL